jgi:hypothetical protein
MESFVAMPSETRLVLAAFIGAVLQELVYWYDIRAKLSTTHYRQLIKSHAYWIITGLMIASSTAGTWIWYSGQASSPRDYLVTGAAFPLLFKKAISAIGTNRGRLKLGERRNLALYFYSA